MTLSFEISYSPKERLAKLHERIVNIRQDSLHQLSTSITRRFHTIGIEDLNVKGMLVNARLARSIADMGFHALRRQLEYKASWRAEIAKLLLQDAKLKVFVVGHTDNQGDLAQNVVLSRKRAESVVKALADGYKVDARRLAPKGVASYAPLASNREEAGRQKNRRVELVEQ